MSAYPDDFRPIRGSAFCGYCCDLADEFVGDRCICCHEQLEDRMAAEQAAIDEDADTVPTTETAA